MNKMKLEEAIAKVKAFEFCNKCQTKLLVCIGIANEVEKMTRANRNEYSRTDKKRN